MTTRDEDLARIHRALEAAEKILERFTAGAVEVDRKAGGDPVTEADRSINDALLEILPRDGEGWLSEETADDLVRLDKPRVWIVDPLDGTREFVEGIPEWSVSIGLVENGRPIAGGVLNPTRGQWILGSAETGVTLNGQKVTATAAGTLDEALVLASRSEVRRGEWKRFEAEPFTIHPCGSVAYKLAQVAAGLADATWTLVPKHEWDVAAGVALVLAAGGSVMDLRGSLPAFNRPDPKLDGLIATCPGLAGPVDKLLGISN